MSFLISTSAYLKTVAACKVQSHDSRRSTAVVCLIGPGYTFIPSTFRRNQTDTTRFITFPKQTKMLDFNFHITTPRLYISYCNPSSDAHVDFTMELLHGAASLRVHPGAKNDFPDRAAAQQRLQDVMERFQKTGFGRYLVSLRPENEDADSETPFSERKLEHIGVVSLQLSRFEGMNVPTIPDVGFNFLEQYHGKGYAVEAARGLMKYYEEEKGVHVFAGFTSDQNESAKKVFRRLGFENYGVRRIKGIMWSGEDVDADCWVLGFKEGQKLEDFGI